MKLPQNGTVSFSIRLEARGQRRRLYETTSKWHLFALLEFVTLRRVWPVLTVSAQNRLNRRTAQLEFFLKPEKNMGSLDTGLPKSF
jgi:hypothetical protein